MSKCGGLLSGTERDLLSVVQHQGDLDEGGDALRGQRMTDVRLHRSEREPRGPVLPGAVDSLDRLQFEQVGDGRAGRVGLHPADVPRRAAAERQRLGHHVLLRHQVGGGGSGGTAVVVDGDALQYGEHPVAVRLGPGQRLEDDDADALTEHQAGRPAVERVELRAGVEQPALPEHLGAPGRPPAGSHRRRRPTRRYPRAVPGQPCPSPPGRRSRRCPPPGSAPGSRRTGEMLAAR